MSAEALTESSAPGLPVSPLLEASPMVASPAADRRRFDSQQLFGSAQEVEIAHAGAIYRLRRTALGKLILTK